jgi:hypothetical protein
LKLGRFDASARELSPHRALMPVTGEGGAASPPLPGAAEEAEMEVRDMADFSSVAPWAASGQVKSATFCNQTPHPHRAWGVSGAFPIHRPGRRVPRTTHPARIRAGPVS